MSDELELEVKIAKEAKALEGGILKWGKPSVYACPECHGVLLQRTEGNNTRFRCHTGHAYSTESLLAEFHIRTEGALWGAIRALEEDVLMANDLARQSVSQPNGASAMWLNKAKEAKERADLVRKALPTHEPPPQTEKETGFAEALTATKKSGDSF